MVSPLIRCPDEVWAVAGGDHHMHNHGQLNDPSVGNYGSRIERSLGSLKYGLDLAKFYKVPFIHNGDLTHLKNSIIPQVQHALFLALMAYPDVPIWLNTGNHERPDKHTKLTTLTAFGILPNVTVIPGAWVFNTGKFTAFFLPYYADQEHRQQDLDALLTIRAQAEYAEATTVLFTHYPLSGATISRGLTLTKAPSFSDFSPSRFDLALFSDIHKHQPVGDNGYHLGATHGNSFNEANYECGWWLLGKDDAGVCIWPSRQGGIREFKIADSPEEAEVFRAQGHFVRLNLQKRIEQQLQESEAPRIATAQLSELIEGYLQHRVPVHGKLTEAQQQCINERINWCLQKGAEECV